MIRVVFGPGSDSLVWAVHDTPVARRWLDSFRSALPHGLHEPEQVYSFPGESWTRERIAAAINECLDLIQTQHVVPDRAHAGLTQDQFNQLHGFFVRVRGELDAGTSDWHRSTPDVRSAFQRFNLLVHRWEELVRNETSPFRVPRFVASFNQKFYQSVTEEDLDGFTLERPFGELALNYCHIGKSVENAFFDQDDHLDRIEPQTRFGADFTASFRKRPADWMPILRRDVSAWMDQHRSVLPYPPGDPRLGVGVLYVARLITPPAEALRIIRDKTHLVSVHEDPT